MKEISLYKIECTHTGRYALVWAYNEFDAIQITRKGIDELHDFDDLFKKPVVTKQSPVHGEFIAVLIYT